MLECALNSLVRWGLWFCSADGESHGLCSLFERHCIQGCWIGCAASCVFWLSSSTVQFKSYIQPWTGKCELVALPGTAGEVASKLVELFVFGLNSRQTTLPSSLNKWDHWLCYLDDQFCLLDSTWALMDSPGVLASLSCWAGQGGTLSSE